MKSSTKGFVLGVVVGAVAYHMLANRQTMKPGNKPLGS